MGGDNRGYKKARAANQQFLSTLNTNTDSMLGELDKTRDLISGLYSGAGAGALANAEQRLAAMQGSGGAAGATLTGAQGLINPLYAELAQGQAGAEFNLLDVFNQIKQGQTQGMGNYAQLVGNAQQLRAQPFDWTTAANAAATIGSKFIPQTYVTEKP
jgi:hypothetical protein